MLLLQCQNTAIKPDNKKISLYSVVDYDCVFITHFFISQAMVQNNRIELLNHPVCKEYLLMKWWVLNSISCLMLCLLDLLQSLQNNYIVMVF